MQPRGSRTDSGVWIALVVVLIVLLLMGLFVTSAWGGGMMVSGTGASWMISVMLIGVLVFVVLLVFLATGRETVREPSYAYPYPIRPPESNALEILDARYARGEITRDEYLRMRQDLEQRRA